MTATDVILIIISLLVVMLVWTFAFSWLMRRNVVKVIQIFRNRGAVGILNARTPAELGLERRSLLVNMIAPRDYKTTALDSLIRSGAVQVTEGGKMYLQEEIPGAT